MVGAERRITTRPTMVTHAAARPASTCTDSMAVRPTRARGPIIVILAALSARRLAGPIRTIQPEPPGAMRLAEATILQLGRFQLVTHDRSIPQAAYQGASSAALPTTRRPGLPRRALPLRLQDRAEVRHRQRDHTQQTSTGNNPPRPSIRLLTQTLGQQRPVKPLQQPAPKDQASSTRLRLPTRRLGYRRPVKLLQQPALKGQASSTRLRSPTRRPDNRRRFHTARAALAIRRMLTTMAMSTRTAAAGGSNTPPAGGRTPVNLHHRFRMNK